MELLLGTFKSKRKHTNRITCSKTKLDFATFKHKAPPNTLMELSAPRLIKLVFANDKGGGDFVKTRSENGFGSDEVCDLYE